MSIQREELEELLAFPQPHETFPDWRKRTTTDFLHHIANNLPDMSEEINQFLWNYAMGSFNTENMNLEEQMYFKANQIIDIIKKWLEGG